MKNFRRLFEAEKLAYFHHNYGVYQHANRRKVIAVWTASVLSVCVSFFLVQTYLIPLIQKSSYLQKQKAEHHSVPAETVGDDKKLEPIIRNNSELEVIISNKLQSFPSDQSWSVYFYDLGNDSKVEINANKNRDAASLYKLFLLETLEQKVPFAEWENTWLKDQSIYDCVFNMLQEGDDPCSEDLSDHIGLNDVDKLNKKNGYEGTVLSGNGKQTNAKDAGDLIVSLKNGQSMSDFARRYVFDALYQQQIKKGIAKGCGECRTANKLGQLSEVAYDAGVVTHGKKSYVLVVMSQGGDFKQITELTKIIDNYFRN